MIPIRACCTAPTPASTRWNPSGVVIPRSAADVQAVVEFGAREGIPVLPRSGGTSLAGQTVNHAIVMDFSKYLNNVLEVNAEEQWARVQPGIILEQLTKSGIRLMACSTRPTRLPPTAPAWAAASATTPAAPIPSSTARPLDHIRELGRNPIRRLRRPLGRVDRRPSWNPD